MLTSSTNSIPPISSKEDGRKVVIFMIELLGGQPLFPLFTNLDIVVELVYEHTSVEPVVIQRVNDRNTLISFYRR